MAVEGIVVPRADFAPLEQLARHRQSLWDAQRDYVVRRSPLLQREWGDAVPPADLADLGRLPLITKEMLRESQRQCAPYGDYLAADPVDVRRVHRTGGTTGEAMNLALSQRDADLTALVGARAQSASGLRRGDVVIHCLNYQLWMGGYTDHATLEAAGATVVPFGVGNPELLVRTIRELGVTAISCTPSYPAVLEGVLAERGIAPADLGLRLALFGGEAALDVPGFRDRLETTWGFAARNANYGVTDILCNFAGQCEHQDALHFVALDVLHPELVEPDSGELVAWEVGASGELVLTHVAKECQPLVRFRTGDIVRLEAVDPCACGRTAPRLRVVGRSDDMVVVRGVNVFPTSVAAVIHADPALSGEYLIPLSGPGPYDRLPLRVELAIDCAEPAEEPAKPGGLADGTAGRVAERLAQRVKADLRVTADIEVVAHGALPRTDGKSRRVLRDR